MMGAVDAVLTDSVSNGSDVHDFAAANGMSTSAQFQNFDNMNKVDDFMSVSNFRPVHDEYVCCDAEYALKPTSACSME
jgi:hypothetical protein